MWNKTLYENLVGKNFKPSNYKVSSYQDLKDALKKQLLELNYLVFIDNAEHYEGIDKEYTKNNIAFFGVFEEVILGDHFNLNSFINFKKFIEIRLEFYIIKDEAFIFLNEEFKKLEQEYINNPYSTVLSPDNYFNEIRTYTFLNNLLAVFIERNSTFYDKWYHNPSEFRFVDIFEHDYDLGSENQFGPDEKSFCNFCSILNKYTALKIVYNEFTSQNLSKENLDSKKTNPQINKFPAVFCTSYGYNLFNYLMTFLSFDKKKTALLSKYFFLFQEEQLIEEKAPWSEFFRFLLIDHEVTIKKIDDRVQPDDNEFNFLKKIKENFRLQYS